MEKFAIDVLIKQGSKRNIPAKNYVAYCYFNLSNLGTEVPVGIEHSTIQIDDEGNTRQKKLYEYLMVEPVEGWYRLAPMHFNSGRYNILAKESLDIWNQVLTPYGLGVDTWKTVEEYKATLPTGE